jgi:trk system potassium uptake protein TrkH
MSDIRTVFRDIGGIFNIVGIISFITLIVPIYFREFSPHTSFNGIIPLAITAIIFLLIGIPLYFIFRNAEPTNFKSAMVTAALGWVFISLIGSLPFWLLPYNTTTLATMDPLSAFFESMYG